MRVYKPSELLKAKKLGEGTIRTHGGRKVIKKEGKWIPYSEGKKKPNSEGKETKGGESSKKGQTGSLTEGFKDVFGAKDDQPAGYPSSDLLIRRADEGREDFSKKENAALDKMEQVIKAADKLESITIKENWVDDGEDCFAAMGTFVDKSGTKIEMPFSQWWTSENLYRSAARGDDKALNTLLGDLKSNANGKIADYRGE